MPAVHPLLFWSRHGLETAWKTVAMLTMIGRMMMWKWAIEREPNVRQYKDQALTPVSDDDEQTLELLTKTAGAKAAVDHLKKVHDITHGKKAVA